MNRVNINANSFKVKGINNAIFSTYDDALYASNYDATRVIPEKTQEEKDLDNAKNRKSKAKKAKEQDVPAVEDLESIDNEILDIEELS